MGGDIATITFREPEPQAGTNPADSRDLARIRPRHAQDAVRRFHGGQLNVRSSDSFVG